MAEAEKDGAAKDGAVAVADRPERRPPSLFTQMEQELDEMRRHMFELFRWPFPVSYRRPLIGETAWAPTADMYEADGTLVVKAELPGVKKEDIIITLDQGLLTITGQRTEEKEVKEPRYYAAERFAGSFSRSFAIPEGVDANAITADFKEGVLEVRMPLPAQAKAEPTKISVKG
jgi:HSP20 family protein